MDRTAERIQMSLGVPMKLLHEAAGFVVTVELISGDSYKGTLSMVEDNMNCYLHDVIHRSPDGQQVKVDSAYLRGSNILFVNVPDMFVNARWFKTGDLEPKQSKYTGKLKRTYMTVKIRKQSK
jgi:small nuclear ribonucleoprotein D3